MKTKDVFLKHVVPLCGTLIAIGMYASPLMAVMRVRRSDILGELNPLPFALAYANAAGWVAYSMVLRDAYVFAPNGVGIVLALFITLSIIPYARRKVQNWMNFIVVVVASIIVFMGAGTVIPDIKHSLLKTIWGSVAVAIQSCYYFSPLTTLKQVIQHRDSSSLYWPLCLMNFLCAALWFVYGIAIQDWFIGAPNGVGAAFSLVSLALCFVFPRKAEALAHMSAQGELTAAGGADHALAAAVHKQVKGTSVEQAAGTIPSDTSASADAGAV